MPTLARVQAVFAHRNGLPRDAVSSNFWFDIIDTSETTLLVVTDRVRQFYSALGTGQTIEIARFFAQSIPDTGHRLKTYTYDEETGDRLAFPEAPPEIDADLGTFPSPRTSAEAMPSEVALCMSYRNVTGLLVNGGELQTPAARRRGRIYVGPLAVGESEPAATTLEARPTSALISNLNAAGAALRAKNDATATWIVYSRPYAGRGVIVRENKPDLPAIPARSGQGYVIEQVSVDNAWDTQRRRGERATVRTFA